MRTLIRYSLQNLAAHWKLGLPMAILIGLAALFFLTIGGYRLTMKREYEDIPDANLIVQESNTLGELYGSRVPASVETQLHELGFSQIIPEIHDLVGTSVGDMLLLRGIDPLRYQQVNHFTLLSGRELQPDDAPRTAMVGRRLAEKLNLSPGAEILIRGRKFSVCGIFHTGTYADNEAWVSISDAQALLGWGSDVSLFIVPDQGILQPGDTLSGGLSIAYRGRGAYTEMNNSAPLLDAMDTVIRALAVAAVFALANTLTRLAWLHRRELAILRCVGFQASGIVIYLFTQALVLTVAGVIFGVAGTGIVFRFLNMDLVGLSFKPHLDLSLALITFGLAVVISVLGTLFPILWLGRIKPAFLLRNES